MKRNGDGKGLAKPAEAGIGNLIVTLISKGIAIIATPIFTRLLVPEEYGVYSIYVSFMSVFSVALGIGISAGAIYKGLLRYSGSEEEFISSAIVLMAISYLAYLSLSFIFGSALSAFTSLPRHINFLLITEVFLGTAQTVIFASERHHYRYKTICLINLLYAILTPLFAIILINASPIRGNARIYASFIVSLILNVPLIIRKISKSHPLSREMLGYIFKLSAPLLPNAVAMSLIAQGDKIIIEHTLGGAALGKYSLAYSVAFIISAVNTAAHSALQPWLMRKLAEGKEAVAREIGGGAVTLLSGAALLFALFVPEIFKFFAAEEYREAEGSVYPLILAAMLLLVSRIAASDIMDSEKVWRLSAASSASFILNILLNIFLIPRIGYHIAAFNAAASYLALVIFELLLLGREGGSRILSRECIKPLLALAVGCALAFAFRTVFISRGILAIATVISSAPSLFDVMGAFFGKREKKKA